MTARWVVVGAVVALGLSACSQGGTGSAAEADLPTTTVTETETVTLEPTIETVTLSPETVTVEVTATASEPTPTPTMAASEPESGEAGLETLDVPSANRPLGLDDFFNPRGEWEEGRWNVADRENEQGIAATIRRANDLELRLQNRFSTLSFDAGHANDSESSECTTQIDILVDGELRETHSFEFNVIQSFKDVDISDGNAIKLIVSNTCVGGTSRVVLSRIQVE